VSNSDYIQDQLEQYRALPFLEMKARARSELGCSFSNKDDKQTVERKIIEALGGKSFFPETVDTGRPLPGWTRIKLHANGSDTPIPFNHNGYFGWLPVNVEVDVPNKLARADGALRCSHTFRAVKVDRPVGDTSGEVGDSFVFEETYPFSIIDMVPGPDPRPGREVAVSAKRRDKMEFRDTYGYWPTDEAVKTWTENRIKEDLKHKNAQDSVTR
jgi:hypothetical protein